MSRHLQRGICLAPVLSLAFFSCSKKNDDSGSSASGIPVKIIPATTKEATLEFTNPKKGDVYAVMPYILGDTNIEGGDLSVTAGTFTVSAPGAELKPVLSFRDQTAKLLSNSDLEHMHRMVLNRMTPSTGIEQPDGFWDTVDAIDAAEAQPNMAKLHGASQQTMRERLTQSLLNTQGTNLSRFSQGLTRLNGATRLTDDGACPAALIRPDPTNKSDGTADIPDNRITFDDQTSYCIAYVGNPVTETNKETIKGSIATSIRRYKELVYKGVEIKDFDGDYTFKPIIVILPFHDQTVWPDMAANSEYKVAGAYIRAMSIQMNQPTFYMATDLNKVKPDADATKLRDLWHSTIAHEMHHAFMDYFKTKFYSNGVDAPSKLELLTYDEGLAHYFEDVNGYLKNNFPTYTGPFLSGFLTDADQISGTFLWAANTKDTDPSMRGSGHAFFHYLVSRAGGITFSNGEFDADSKGIVFLRNLIKADGKGLANLKSAVAAAGISEDWTTLMGHYLGALAVDGADTATTDDTAKTQGSTTGVKNTIGEGDKTAGFNFNNYAEGKDPKGRLADARSAGSMDKDPIELGYYNTKALTYQITDPTASAKIIFGDVYKNAAISIVKIKSGP